MSVGTKTKIYHTHLKMLKSKKKNLKHVINNIHWNSHLLRHVQKTVLCSFSYFLTFLIEYNLFSFSCQHSIFTYIFADFFFFFKSVFRIIWACSHPKLLTGSKSRILPQAKQFNFKSKKTYFNFLYQIEYYILFYFRLAFSPSAHVRNFRVLYIEKFNALIWIILAH